MTEFINILRLLPAIIEAVKAVEAAIPLPGKGKEKLDFILDLAKEFGVNADKFIAVVNLIVGLFNKTGIFKTSK